MPMLASPSRRALVAAASCLTALAGALPAHAQLTGRDRWADSVRVEIERANSLADTVRLGAARLLVDRALAAHPGDPLLLHYKGYALYRASGLLQGSGRAADSRPLLEEADRVLAQSAERLPLPETLALRSAVLGQIIGVSRGPIAGMRLGPKVSSLMDDALDAGRDNPRVWLLRGIGAIYSPKMWGGGLEKAEQHLTRAASLLASDRPAPPLPAWGHADVYVWLGQVYQKQGRRDAARTAYQRALALDPTQRWVRLALLPSLDAR